MPNPPGVSNLTPQQRSQRASIAALTRWSREDPAANAARGQAGLLARYEREAREADPAISDAEAARRAAASLRAHSSGWRSPVPRRAARPPRRPGGEA